MQSLWDRIAATAGHVPLQEWQQALLEERLTAHHHAPDEARPWKDVIDRVQDPNSLVVVSRRSRGLPGAAM